MPEFNYLTCHDPDEDDEHGYGDGEELGGGEAAAVAERDLVAFAARPERNQILDYSCNYYVTNE